MRQPVTRTALHAGATVLAVVALAGSLGGCLFTTDVALVRDDRVEIEAPEKASDERLPVTIRWRAEDVDGRTFAVFLDRSPVRPGDTLRELAEDERDDACLASPSCPDADWLRNRGVYLVDGRELELAVLPDRRETGRGARDSHEVTLVLMDGDRRDGEASWTRQFYVDREGS